MNHFLKKLLTKIEDAMLTHFVRRSTTTVAPACYKNFESRLTTISYQILIKYYPWTFQNGTVITFTYLKIN